MKNSTRQNTIWITSLNLSSDYYKSLGISSLVFVSRIRYHKKDRDESVMKIPFAGLICSGLRKRSVFRTAKLLMNPILRQTRCQDT